MKEFLKVALGLAAFVICVVASYARPDLLGPAMAVIMGLSALVLLGALLGFMQSIRYGREMREDDK